jgi:hypothetical protein
MTNKVKTSKIDEPTIKKGSTLTADIRAAFNNSMDKVINADDTASITYHDFMVLVQGQLNANKSVKNKNVFVSIKEDGKTKTVKRMKTVIPFGLWGEYSELIKYRQYDMGVKNGLFQSENLTETEVTQLTSQTSSAVIRLKERLGKEQDISKGENGKAKHFPFYWEACQTADAVKGAKVKKDSIVEFKPVVLESMEANGLDAESAMAVVVGDRAKANLPKIPVKGQKAVIDDIKSDIKAVEKEYVDIAVKFLKDFKTAPTDVKKRAIPQLLKIKLA